MYDAIVVGARCAGSATAMLLARRGYKVLMVDKAGFPSDTLSTHYIHQPGVAALARWQLLDEVASVCPAIPHNVFDVGPFALRGTPPPAGDQSAAYAPRRASLDMILLEAARARGVEVRERYAVKDVVSDGDRMTGIEGRSEGGTTVKDEARLVIGADGIHSVIAREVEAPTYEERPAYSCAYYTYWSGVPVDGAELYPRPGRMLIAAPTNDGLTLTIVYWPTAEFHEVRAGIERSFLQAIDTVPQLAERVRGGTREEPFRGSAQLQGYFRRPYGPGWALVGDSGYHKNPITAEGITDAFRDAELLADAADAALSGRVREQDAFAEYERARNAASLPIYEMTADLAKLEPPTAEMVGLFEALASDQRETDRFLGTIAGTVPIPEFFAPENLQAIVAGAMS